jgi:hypothetical protein
VTHKLNPALSNAPWGNKREAFSEFTTLYLNKGLVNDHVGGWDEDTIRERGKTLARRRRSAPFEAAARPEGNSTGGVLSIPRRTAGC